MKRVGLVSAIVVLAINGLGVIVPRAYAAAQTCTWTGAGSDSKFSTPENWTDCNNDVPQAGDTINFPYANVTNNQVITNDIASTAFGGITITVGPDGDSKYIAITALKMVDGADLGSEPQTGAALYVAVGSSADPAGWGSVTGTGALTLKGYIEYKNIVIPGVLTVDNPQSWYSYQTGDNFSALVVSADSKVAFPSPSATNTFDKPITLNGGLNAALSFDGVCTGGFGCSYSPTTWTLSGLITVNATTFIDTSPNMTVKFTGTVSNKSALSNGANAHGSFQFGETAEVLPVTTVKFEGEHLTSPADVLSNQIGILSGKWQTVSVYKGGTLKGSGSVVNGIYVSEGGVVAPGNSPGCLTSDTLSLSGEYQFELGGSDPCTGYDQLIVKNTSNVTSPVVIDSSSAVLTTSRYNDYTPKQGDVFVIISQEGDKAVSGTFMGLPEGATFTQNGIVFKISYVGGDGNDVTLTVQNSPTAPDTGVQILKSNPAVIAAATILAAVVLLGLAKRARQ